MRLFIADVSLAIHEGIDIQFLCPQCKVTTSPHVSFDVSDVSFDHSGRAVDEPDTDADSDLVLDDNNVLPEQPVTYHLVNTASKHNKQQTEAGGQLWLYLRH